MEERSRIDAGKLIIPGRINLRRLTIPQNLIEDVIVHGEELAVAFVERFGVLD